MADEVHDESYTPGCCSRLSHECSLPPRDELFQFLFCVLRCVCVDVVIANGPVEAALSSITVQFALWASTWGVENVRASYIKNKHSYCTVCRPHTHAYTYGRVHTYSLHSYCTVCRPPPPHTHTHIHVW